MKDLAEVERWLTRRHDAERSTSKSIVTIVVSAIGAFTPLAFICVPIAILMSLDALFKALAARSIFSFLLALVAIACVVGAFSVSPACWLEAAAVWALFQKH